MALNRKGDSGSPCFTPLFSLTSTVEPLCSICVVNDLYGLIMEERIAKGIPSR